MMLAVVFAQAAVKTDRKQRWMVCKLMSDSGADDGKVNFIFNQGSNAKTTNPLINCWTHNKMDKLKRLFFLSELASFRTTCSSLWLMLLSNCHNSLYKGENLLAIDYLLRAVRRFTLSGFSPEGVLTRVYTERGEVFALCERSSKLVILRVLPSNVENHHREVLNVFCKDLLPHIHI